VWSAKYFNAAVVAHPGAPLVAAGRKGSHVELKPNHRLLLMNEEDNPTGASGDERRLLGRHLNEQEPTMLLQASLTRSLLVLCLRITVVNLAKKGVG